MPLLEAPLNTANQHAASADDYLAQGLLIPAAEEHQKAAEAYTAAVDRCTDEHTKRTLRMLYEDHLKAEKELQRRIAKLREEGKDPSLPQKPPPSSHPSGPISAANLSGANYSPRRVPSPPPPGRRLTDSNSTGEESFMVLGQRSDPGDAFNHFWKIMEGMLENLSQPVAFATAPLAADYPPISGLHRNGSLSSDTDIDEPMTKRFTGRKNGKDGDKKAGKVAHVDIDADDFEDDMFDEGGDELSESFYLIPPSNATSKAASSSAAAMSTLKKENAALKTDLETMQKRIAATERVLRLRKDQDQQLKESIYLARREAQRAMGASAMLPLSRPPGQPATVDLGALNVNPNANMGAKEVQLVRRVRELEEEVRILKDDNTKQKAMISRFRERWDKLKESAKRKKDAKTAVMMGVASSSSTGLKEPVISEEPEEEQESEQVVVKS